MRTVPFLENLQQRVLMFLPRDIDASLDELCLRMFPASFLELPDDDFEDQSRNFPTKRDRVTALELTKRADKDGFPKKGFVLQAIAAGWHHKSKEQLRRLGDEVGRERIVVMHGTVDRMITFKHAEVLAEEIGEGVDFRVFEGCGHVLLWERMDEFHEIVEQLVKKTEALSR